MDRHSRQTLLRVSHDFFVYLRTLIYLHVSTVINRTDNASIRTMEFFLISNRALFRRIGLTSNGTKKEVG